MSTKTIAIIENNVNIRGNRLPSLYSYVKLRIFQPSPLSTCYSGRVAENGIGLPSRSNATQTGLNSITQKEGSCNFSGFGF